MLMSFFAFIYLICSWDGSQFFSYAVGSPSNVTKIVNNFVKLVKDFDLDGIDIDWVGIPDYTA